MKIEHIGIAVKNIEESKKVFDSLFGFSSYKEETVESENVLTVFYKTGESKIELLQSTVEDGIISKYIAKKGEGMHHIAFAVDDIFSEMKRLTDEGFQLLNAEPKPGADNKLICFLHPKNTNGVLIELCQEIK